MPLLKPEQIQGLERGGWKNVEWPFPSHGSALIKTETAQFDVLMKKFSSHLRLQKSPQTPPSFRIIVLPSGVLLATADEVGIAKDCLEIDTIVGSLATEIEMGQLTIKEGREEAELLLVFRQYWNNNNDKPLDEELDDFEELLPSDDQAPLVFAPLTEESRRRVQRDIRRRRGKQSKNRLFKWRHMRASTDDIELGCISGEKELEEVKDTKEGKGEKEKEKEKPEVSGNDEWLWMEVPYSKEGDEEFWDMKENVSYEYPSQVDDEKEFVDLGTFVAEEFELSSDTSWKNVNKEGFRDERRYQAMKSTFFSSREAKVASTWASVTIPSSRKDSSRALKELIRHGVPDSKRGKVWMSVAGCNEFYAAYPNSYEDVIDRVFGPRIPKKFYQLPQFGGELRPGDHMLSAEGLECTQRVLWALAMENPDVDYIPPIPDAVCIALSFLKEADAYTLINLMIDQSRDDRWFFSMTNKHTTLFLLTFNSLLQKYLPKLAAHIERLDVGLVAEFADAWFKRLFVTALPYHTVLRVFDVFVNEGSGMLYRVALALLRVSSVSLMGCTSRAQFLNTLQQICVQYQDADHLIRSALQITSISRKEMETHDIMNSPLIKTVREPDYKPFYRPKIDVASDILEEINFEALWSLVPSRYSIMDPTLIFSTTKHGFSLKSLIEKCEPSSASPCVLIIKDKSKRIFGVFASKGLKMKNSYCGSTECFLFTLVPEVKKYGWLAGHQRLFCRITLAGLAFGDDRGLLIDDELWHGSSNTSETFANEPLSGKDTDFDCVALEVIGFKNASS